MKWIWTLVTMLFGLWGFMFIREHFIYVFPYLAAHLLLVMLWWHLQVSPFPLPTPLVPLVFLAPQGIYAVIQASLLINQGLEDATRLMDFRFNLISSGVLIVEYGLLYVFMNKPKYYRF